MASKRVDVLDAVVGLIKTIPSGSKLGSVNDHPRNLQQINDYPSVDVVLGAEEREQQPSFQAKRTLSVDIYVHHFSHDQRNAHELAEEIENVLRDDLTLGGVVTDGYSLGCGTDEGLRAQQGGVMVVLPFAFRYHETED